MVEKRRTAVQMTKKGAASPEAGNRGMGTAGVAARSSAARAVKRMRRTKMVTKTKGMMTFVQGVPAARMTKMRTRIVKVRERAVENLTATKRMRRTFTLN